MEWTLPEDVVRHILSYAFPWHRDNVERERAWHVARGPPERGGGHSVFKPREILKRNRGRKSLFVSFCEGCGDPRGIYSVGWKTCMTSALHLPLRAAMPSSHLTGPFYTIKHHRFESRYEGRRIMARQWEHIREIEDIEVWSFREGCHECDDNPNVDIPWTPGDGTPWETGYDWPFYDDY